MRVLDCSVPPIRHHYKLTFYTMRSTWSWRVRLYIVNVKTNVVMFSFLDFCEFFILDIIRRNMHNKFIFFFIVSVFKFINYKTYLSLPISITVVGVYEIEELVFSFSLMLLINFTAFFAV